MKHYNGNLVAVLEELCSQEYIEVAQDALLEVQDIILECENIEDRKARDLARAMGYLRKRLTALSAAVLESEAQGYRLADVLDSHGMMVAEEHKG